MDGMQIAPLGLNAEEHRCLKTREKRNSEFNFSEIIYMNHLPAVSSENNLTKAAVLDSKFHELRGIYF